MNQNYFKGISLNLGHSDIVFDQYHISALVNRDIDNLRKDLQTQLDEKQKSLPQGMRVYFSYETTQTSPIRSKTKL